MRKFFYVASCVGMNDETFTVETACGVYGSPEAARDAAVALIPNGLEPTSIKIDVYDARMLREMADQMDGVSDENPSLAKNGGEPDWSEFDASRGEYGVFVEMLLSDGTTQTMNAHDWFFTVFLRGSLAEPFIRAHRIVGEKAPSQKFEEA